MKKYLLIFAFAAFASCGVMNKQEHKAPTRNVYWEIVDSYVILDDGKKVADLPVGIPVTVCVKYKKRTGPLDGPGIPYVGRQRTEGQVFNMIMAAEEGEKFAGGLDTLSAKVILDRRGRGYIHNVVVEYAPNAK